MFYRIESALTKFFFIDMIGDVIGSYNDFFALLAQLVEQLPLKQTVEGSNPPRRTNKLEIQSAKLKVKILDTLIILTFLDVRDSRFMFYKFAPIAQRWS